MIKITFFDSVADKSLQFQYIDMLKILENFVGNDPDDFIFKY